jgi:hypothetical protein
MAGILLGVFVALLFGAMFNPQTHSDSAIYRCHATVSELVVLCEEAWLSWHLVSKPHVPHFLASPTKELHTALAQAAKVNAGGGEEVGKKEVSGTRAAGCDSVITSDKPADDQILGVLQVCWLHFLDTHAWVSPVPRGCQSVFYFNVISRVSWTTCFNANFDYYIDMHIFSTNKDFRPTISITFLVPFEMLLDQYPSRMCPIRLMGHQISSRIGATKFLTSASAKVLLSA